MTMVIDDFRVELREHLGGLDSNDLPDTRADLLLNRSYWELEDKFPFRKKEKTSTFNLTIGERKYAMPAPYEALRFISIEMPDTTDKAHEKLIRMGRPEYEGLYVNRTDARGLPTHYIREADDFILWVTPDVAYPLTVGYWGIFSDLSDANPTPEVPQVWHEILLMGAVWRGFLRLEDFAKAQAMKAHQISLIKSTATVESKEETDSRDAGISVPDDLFRI